MSDTELAIVVIGRNEGDRLLRCLSSLKDAGHPIIYVDSGSADNSVKNAKDFGAVVHSLDPRKPFTAARARNEGYTRARALFSALTYVQFLDGDCEIENGWLERAVSFLRSNNNAAVVCGRRREIYPDHSVYNRLCDLEWNKPHGHISSCGGDAMFRVAALEGVGGYLESLIAGEEPELCLRLRRSGWEIRSIDQPMTLHDANLSAFSQWWARMRRSGHAYIEGLTIHFGDEEHYNLRETLRPWLWGVAPLVLGTLLILAIGPLGFAVLLIYPVQVLWLAFRTHVDGVSRLRFGTLMLLARFAELAGQLEYLISRAANRSKTLIEYK